MTWAAPVAFAGFALIALPVLVHLLGLGRSQRRRFPSLRFITSTRLQPSRRTRLHDVPLLIVRAGAVAAATFALARPVPDARTPAAERAPRAMLARVVIVDTSASMRRAGAAAEAARLADSLSSEMATVVRTVQPASALAGAAAWLGTLPQRGEVVVVSDFQRGTLDAETVAAVPAGVGVVLLRAGASPRGSAERAEERFAQAGRTIVASAAVQAHATDIRWTGASGTLSALRTPSARERAVDPLVVLAGDGQQRAADAALAASQVVAEPIAAARPASVAVVLPRYEGRSALIRDSSALHAPWQGDLLARLAMDPAFRASGAALPSAAVVRTRRGQLTLFASTAATDPRTVTLLAALRRVDANSGSGAVGGGAGGGSPQSELEPSVLTEAELDALRTAIRARVPASETGEDARQEAGRVASGAARSVGAGDPVPPDSPVGARWLWAVALVLLGIEHLVRRARGARRAVGEAHDAA